MLQAAIALFAVAPVSGRPVDRHVATWNNCGPSSQSMNGGSFNTPFVGNGDVSAAISVAWNGGKTKQAIGKQSLMFGKSDTWISDSTAYFSHMSAAELKFDLQPRVPTIYADPAVQDLGNGKVSLSMLANTSDSPSMNMSTIVGENNLVITTLTCVGNSSGATKVPDCDVDFNLGDTSGNHYKLEEMAGLITNGSLPIVFFRKENLHGETNAAWVGTCNPEVYLYSVEREFTVDKDTGKFSFRNGSCLWIADADPSNITQVPISTGACDDPKGQWAWVPFNSTEQRGDIMFKGGAFSSDDSTSYCLTTGGRSSDVRVTSDACGKGMWSFNSSSGDLSGYLQYSSENSNGDSCLIVIPDNSNNTLGVAVTLIDQETNAPPQGLKPKKFQPPASYPSGLVNVSTGFTATLKQGKTYLLITAILTLRDIGCAGTRIESGACTQRIEKAAADLVAANADPSIRAKTIKTQQDWWSNYWNASSIDLGGRNDTSTGGSTTNANVTLVEHYWYLQQYVLACTTRQGKIAPSLIGNLVHSDPSAWNDQLTLDYNFEANFWGAGAANHPEMYLPYIATVTNPGLVATMRGRATNPGVWKDTSSSSLEWTTQIGHTSSRAIIVPTPPTGYPDLSNSTGYKGAAWTSTAFPLGDGRPDPSDYGTRFVGGLVASDMIQYYEYTLDVDMLRDVIYPVVRDNAEYYRTYVRPDPRNSSLVYIPWGCAQEMCSCRNGGPGYGGYKDIHILPQRNMTKNCAETMKDNATARANWNCPGAFADTGKAGEHNAHPDIAFAAQSFRKALEYSKLLGVDDDLRDGWTDTLAKLPPYPRVTLDFLPGAIGEEVNGQTLLTEGLVGPTVEPLPWYNASAPYFTGPVWPWCNSEYPITNYAAMWPTDEIGTLQTGRSDPDLLQAAHDTVWAINQYTGYDFAGSKTPWANSNGLCLSWPPAVRVSDESHAKDLVDKFSRALGRMSPNGLLAFRGGMLENMGGSIAISDMLLQSHTKVIRLFPVWNPKDTASGGASFTSLRAYGAFLVSASLDEDGVVGSPVTVTSEKGADCQFISPWASARDGNVVVKDAAGNTVQVNAGSPTGGDAHPDQYWFKTDAGMTYYLSQA